MLGKLNLSYFSDKDLTQGFIQFSFYSGIDGSDALAEMVFRY